MEVCAACEVHVVRHVAVEVVIPKAVVLPPILVQKSARRRLAITQSALLNIVSVTLVKSVKKGEQDEADNGDLGVNVAAEVRNKSHRKNKKKRAQEDVSQ